jgi:hypothetical protein
MIEVKDGARTLQFNGALLGKSTSYRHGSTRWIEFELYRTESGSYVLSRVGVSIVYHGAACRLVQTYKLQEVLFKDIVKNSLPCDICNPDRSTDFVFPEKHRYWAQVSEEPSAVLDALYKYDDNGARYLTNVAQRLLESSAQKDSGIDSIYRVEVIP